jgi:aspartyl-tRNA(Asn)/glutamyl-tRNA(Gln) amidotransferase subunit C
MYNSGMVNLTREDVHRLAMLAKITITEDEIAQMQKDLDSVLAYVEKLQDVDTSNLEPTNQVTGLKNIMRNDEVIDYGMSQEALLANVPEVEKNYIKTKRVL